MIAGFNEKYLFWDDEDDNNQNKVSGAVPAGIYDQNTKIYYCCRTDGDVNTLIPLPTDKPFYLLNPNKESACQKVQGVKVAQEWIMWDCQDAGTSEDTGPLAIPGYHTAIKIYFCFYFL